MAFLLKPIMTNTHVQSLPYISQIEQQGISTKKKCREMGLNRKCDNKDQLINMILENTPPTHHTPETTRETHLHLMK
ncbi:hypothetical protein E2C01_089434 [Portunus trituberculatus]|uniref:SAP domain-containing protein n=1 Tax=Portunus trituberculatus TaxID=210409 RepID=A0A5B7JDJ5_PORTR|nr:hypothetical protein [Portunus trituberculatus]